MEKFDLNQDLIGTGEAAQITGREPSTFRYALMRGDVRGWRVGLGDVWLMRRKDIQEYAKTRHWPERGVAEREAIKRLNGFGAEVETDEASGTVEGQ